MNGRRRPDAPIGDLPEYSILVGFGRGGGSWHGYIEHGIFRQV